MVFKFRFMFPEIEKESRFVGFGICDEFDVPCLKTNGYVSGRCLALCEIDITEIQARALNTKFPRLFKESCVANEKIALDESYIILCINEYSDPYDETHFFSWEIDKERVLEEIMSGKLSFIEG